MFQRVLTRDLIQYEVSNTTKIKVTILKLLLNAIYLQFFAGGGDVDKPLSHYEGDTRERDNVENKPLGEQPHSVETIMCDTIIYY